ncbi:hypothetical protein [Desulfuribacillus alkaliarsenatis]|nr:hypothetical protein [Desulfuribacillus alkaliarsenatis]
MLILFGSLIFSGCENERDRISTIYVGEGTDWKAEFAVNSTSTNTHTVDVSISFLGDYSEVKDNKILLYRYWWAHKDAEFVGDVFSGDHFSSDNILFHGDSSEPTITVIGGGGGLPKDDRTQTFTYRETISNDIADFADSIKVMVEWDGKVDVFMVKEVK